MANVDFDKVLEAMFKELDYQLSLDVAGASERLVAGAETLNREYGSEWADMWTEWFTERYAEDFYDTLSL